MEEKVINYFVCDYCNKEFNTAEECEQHEKQHSLPAEILNVAFFNSDKYPSLLQVKFENGNTVDYVRNDGTRFYTNDYVGGADKRLNNEETIFIPRIIWNKINVIVSKAKSEFLGNWNRENDMTFETLIEEKYRTQRLDIGDKIYKCDFDEDKGKDVVETFKVYEATYVDGVKAYNCEGRIKNNTVYCLFKKYEIGVSVFLTKQDAQRLADKKNENII